MINIGKSIYAIDLEISLKVWRFNMSKEMRKM